MCQLWKTAVYGHETGTMPAMEENRLWLKNLSHLWRMAVYGQIKYYGQKLSQLWKTTVYSQETEPAVEDKQFIAKKIEIAVEDGSLWLRN